MAIKFSNLHGHSGMSIYDAIGTPEKYAEWMLKNAGEDSGAFAITDHGNMNAVGQIVTAQKQYMKKGTPVKFIYGVEAYFTPSLDLWAQLKQKKEEEKKEQKEEKKKKKNEEEEIDSTDLVVENEKESKGKFYDPFHRRNHLVLVAQNQEGLKNLFRLVSRSYREGFYKKPRIDLKMLKELNSGLIASTACVAGVPSWCSMQNSDDQEAAMKLYDQELLPLMEIFGKDRFFLELQFNKLPEQQIVNRDLIEYSKRTGYSLIATADCHYPDPQMFKDREIYRLLGYQMQKENIDLSILDKKREELECELYLKNGDQMFAAYKESFANVHKDEKIIIEAIERSYNIAHNHISTVIPDDSIKLPKTFQVTANLKTPFDRLKQLVLTALKDKNLTSKEYIDRAAFELKVINKLKVSEYFLAKKEILDTLRKHMLTGTGRGSGAGSLVCYLLNITFLDPIKHGLLFERFLSPSRAEMPDVDSDVELKDEALDILKSHFGHDAVLAVSNYNRLTLKALMKDLAKLYGIPFQEVNSVTTVAEAEARDKILADIGHDQKLYEFNLENAKKHSPTFNTFLQKYPHLGDSVENLFKEVKSVGRHAGGVLIIPDAEACLPIIRIRGVDQSPITEGITAQYLKHFGLIKFDVLGLSTLKIIRRCIEIILEKNGEESTIENVWKFYNEFLHPDKINANDYKVFEKVYCGSKFPSIFQFEKTRVQSFCSRATPYSVKDISALTALWRPGPLCISGKSTISLNLPSANRHHGTKTITIEDLYNQFHKYGPEFRANHPLCLKSYNEESKRFVKNKILNVFKSGKKKVYKINFQREDRYDHPKVLDSSKFEFAKRKSYLTASEDHLFLTTKGWKRLGDLEFGDYLLFERLHSFSSDDPMKNIRKKNSVKGRKNFRNIAFKSYEYKCIFCDWSKASLDVNHVYANRHQNNDPENLSFLCPNHHREYSEGKIPVDKLIAAREKYKITYNKEVQSVRFISKELVGSEETFDISVESPHNNFVAGGFVVHNSGGADKKYIDFDPDASRKEHPIIKEVLGETRGLLLYQEQFMILAHKLAGFSLEEADKLRKLLVKPSTTNADEIKKERTEIGNKFISNCVNIGGLTLERATELWEKEILGFISYGFNKSHAIAYAYDSYQCAWLYTYYEDEWMRACLEKDPELEKTIATTRSLGYHVAKVDINHSPVKDWNLFKGSWMPPLTSLKGVGKTGSEELQVEKPSGGFKDIKDFFFDSQGEWRWSKLNKKIVGVLIQAEAFESLGCVGTDKLFKNYKHMYDFVINHWNELKNKKKTLDEAALHFCEDWTPAEKIQIQRDIMGFYDKGLVIGKHLKMFSEFEILAIDEYGSAHGESEDEEYHGNMSRVWAVVESVEVKKTKNGKSFLTVTVTGMSEKKYYFKVWNSDNIDVSVWREGNVVVFSLDYSDQFGYSLSRRGKVLRVNR